MNRGLERTLTAERRFVMACARLQPEPAVVAAAAAQVSSWECVLDEARTPHLAPLLARAIERCPNATIPADVRARLQAERQKTMVRNAMYLRSAREVLRAFVHVGLRPIVLKGVALVEELYEDIALRAFCDVDVLFAIEELKAAEEVLADLGYRPEPAPHDRSWYFENYYQLPRYARKGGGFCVELHWDFGRRPNPFCLDVAAMRARAAPVTVAGVNVHTLDDADQLLHLCLHLAWGNGFDGHVRGLVDIAELIRRGMDWDVFERRVIAGHVAQVVVPALELAEWLLDAPVDLEVLARLGKHRGSALTRFFTGIGQSRVLTGGEGHRTLMRLFWLEHMSQRVHLLRQNFGPVEHAEYDTRPPLLRRLMHGFRRAASPFFNHV